MLLGKLYATRGIADQIEKSVQFRTDVICALQRYAKHDWGDLCEEDRALNDAAAAGAERVLAAYPSSLGKIWIITEWDRSATTILFPSEY